MVKKSENPGADNMWTPPLPGAMRESAQQIWQAGLGAFARAQEEGSKVFDKLVKEGVTLQQKTQAAAEERMSEATSKMAGMASDINAKTGKPWDKLETIFEERVAKALEKLGMPSAREVAALKARIDALEKAAAVKPVVRKSAARAQTVARKTPAKRATRPAAKKPV